MAYTKQQLIEDAFNELGLGSYLYNLTAEELTAALRKLDQMMAAWNRRGLRLGYPLSSDTDTALSEEVGITDMAHEAAYLGLAIRLAPSYGKQVSGETLRAYKESYNALLGQSVKPQEMQLANLPRGAGAKPWRTVEDPFLDKPADNTDAGPDTELEYY